jgi:flagellar protein FlaI
MAGDDAEADGEPADGASRNRTGADQPEEATLEPAVRRVAGGPHADSDADSSGPAFDSDALESAVVRVEDAETDPGAVVGDYTWVDYLDEYGPEDAADRVRAARERERREQAQREAEAEALRPNKVEVEPPYPEWDELDAAPPEPDWEALDADPTPDLGFEPEAMDAVVDEAARRAKRFHAFFDEYTDPETTPVVKDEWLWEHYKRE